MKKIIAIAALGWLVAGGAMPAPAQLAVPPPAPAYQPLAAPQMDQLLGPIALYPDPLIAQILPASTFPTEIVLADRYVSGGGEPNLIDQQPWDASVQALARYPEVLQWMDQNLDWTTELGDAFINQPQDVMDSIQRLRAEAENYGNLEATPQQQVVEDGGDIEILPVDPGMIYVPVYQPAGVYFQSGFGLAFGAGFVIGNWLDCDFDWQHHNLVQWSRDHPRPADWWHERPEERHAAIDHDARVWRPEGHHDAGSAPRGDRGWDNHQAAPEANRPEERPQSRTVTVIGRSGSEPRPAATTAPRSGRPEQTPTVITFGSSAIQPRPAAAPRPASVRPTPAPAQNYQPISHPASNGAYIGIQSSQETRSYSDRGRQSTEAVNHPAPAPAPRSEPVSHPSPPSGGGGGGGGAHGGGPPARQH